MIITPSTKLDAVNEIISSVGSSPVNSLDDELNVDVVNAISILDSVSREIQSRGYAFNTLNNITLKPDVGTGLVPYPNSYLRVIVNKTKYINRSGYFFDLESGDQEFPEGIVVNELVKELEFEELPSAFRKYITARASRIFQMRYLSSSDIDIHLQLEEANAYSEIVDYDLALGNYNIFTDDLSISQNISRS